MPKVGGAPDWNEIPLDEAKTQHSVWGQRENKKIKKTQTTGEK
jgi:hypothetical protein